MPTEDEKRIATWRNAGPELGPIRGGKLRNLSDNARLKLLGVFPSSEGVGNGLVVFQD